MLPHRCLRRITARVVTRVQLIPAPTMRSLVPKEEVFVPSPVTPTQVWVEGEIAQLKTVQGERKRAAAAAPKKAEG